MAKDALGAAVTLAAIGAFLLQATNPLARPSGAKLNRQWSRVTSTTLPLPHGWYRDRQGHHGYGTEP